MRARVLLASCAVAFLSVLRPLPAAAAVPGACQDGVLPSGALSRICIPAFGWNGDLVIWAHGYVAFNQPLDFYHLEIGPGVDLPTIAQSLGFAFATTSYRQNGLTIIEGVDDVQELLAAFTAAAGSPPGRAFLAGASEGGIIATLTAELSPNSFSGVLAACGPIGSFRAQVDYVGDFRVLFDAYFPGVLPGPATAIPDFVIDQWDGTYEPAVGAALRAQPARARELMKVGHVPYDAADFENLVRAAEGVLWYNVFGTNDAAGKLGGNPFDNRHRWYSGSSNDLLLNLVAARFDAAPAALSAMDPYETTGVPATHLVLLHTIGDEIIPYGHEIVYRAKNLSQGITPPTLFSIPRYGHCNFTAEEMVLSFLYLVLTS